MSEDGALSLEICLISGGATSIARSLAAQLAQAGHAVVLCTERQPALESLWSPRIRRWSDPLRDVFEVHYDPLCKPSFDYVEVAIRTAAQQCGSRSDLEGTGHGRICSTFMCHAMPDDRYRPTVVRAECACTCRQAGLRCELIMLETTGRSNEIAEAYRAPTLNKILVFDPVDGTDTVMLMARAILTYPNIGPRLRLFLLPAQATQASQDSHPTWRSVVRLKSDLKHMIVAMTPMPKVILGCARFTSTTGQIFERNQKQVDADKLSPPVKRRSTAWSKIFSTACH